MSSRQKKLQEDTEFRVLRMLEAQPDATQRDLAENAGISVGALNYCLKVWSRCRTSARAGISSVIYTC